MFKPPRPASMDLNLAPMVDVLMCLIIFFLLASKMVENENYTLKLASAAAARPLEKSELGNRVTINVVQGAAATDPARYFVADWNGQEVVQSELSPEALNRYVLARAKAAAGAELRCVIRADGDVTYADVETVLRAAGLAKIAKVVFAANQDTGPQEPGS